MVESEVGRVMVGAPFREASVAWVDDATGINCKARLDAFAEPHIYDLKNIRRGKAAPGEHGFGKYAWSYRWDIRAAHYFKACDAAGVKATHYNFVAFEKAPMRTRAGLRVPMCNHTLYRMSEEGQIALMEWREAMNTLAACLRDDKWPCYPASASVVWPRRVYIDEEGEDAPNFST